MEVKASKTESCSPKECSGTLSTSRNSLKDKLCEYFCRTRNRYHIVKRVLSDPHEWRRLMGITHSYEYTTKVLGALMKRDLGDLDFNNVHEVAANWENGLPLKLISASVGGFLLGGTFGLGHVIYRNRQNIYQTRSRAIFQSLAKYSVMWMKNSSKLTTIDSFVTHINEGQRSKKGNALIGSLSSLAIYPFRGFNQLADLTVSGAAFGIFFGSLTSEIRPKPVLQVKNE